MLECRQRKKANVCDMVQMIAELLLSDQEKLIKEMLSLLESKFGIRLPCDY